MSHYSVGVIASSVKEAEKMLEPYSEHLEVFHISQTHDDVMKEAYEEKKKFAQLNKYEGAREYANSRDFRFLERCKKEHIEIQPIINALVDKVIDNTSEKKWAATEPILDNLANLMCTEITTLKVPKVVANELSQLFGYIWVAYRLANTDNDELFDAYCHYCGYHDNVDENGNITSTYNPLSKWDWYEIGGRFSNLIRTKNGIITNYARIADIDFSPAKDLYNRAIRFWEVAVEGKEQKEDENIFVFYKPEYYLDTYGDKETYAKICSLPIPYATLTRKGWFAPGEMGWFGMDSAAPEEKGKYYCSWYDNFLKDANPDDLYIIFDCHI